MPDRLHRKSFSELIHAIHFGCDGGGEACIISISETADSILTHIAWDGIITTEHGVHPILFNGLEVHPVSHIDGVGPCKILQQFYRAADGDAVLNAILNLIPCLRLEQQRICNRNRILHICSIVHADIFPPFHAPRPVFLSKRIQPVYIECNFRQCKGHKLGFCILAVVRVQRKEILARKAGLVGYTRLKSVREIILGCGWVIVIRLTATNIHIGSKGAVWPCLFVLLMLPPDLVIPVAMVI